MTQHFENMLYMFAHNANESVLKTAGSVDVEEIRRLSVEQGIWTMVYPALSKVCDVEKYRNEFFSRVMIGIAQKEFTLSTIEKITKAGVPCCLLKGASLSGLYAESECRISGDTDILIDPKDEKKIEALLIEMGYCVEKREKNDHHLKAYHKKGGLLEVHIKLYSDITEKVLFAGEQLYVESWKEINIDGKKFNMLGINDGLMYLTTHYIKHLVCGGGGVRQMMDLLLYMEHYKDAIDFERYNRIIKELGYDKLIGAIRTIGTMYFGFEYDCLYPELAERILTDTEAGGIFGKSTDLRTNFYDAFCEKRTSMNRAKFKVYMNMHNERGLLARVIPGQKMLIDVYGYKYAKHKILIPLAWLNRYVDIIKRFYRKRTNVDMHNEFQTRMQLMRDLGMIE